MKKIPYSNIVGNFFKYEFLKTEYLRWGNTQIVKKQSNLFDIVWKDTMKLLPNANFIMHYSWIKWILPLESMKDSKKIDIRYTGNPTDEQKDILDIIKERSNLYLYHGWLIVMKTWRWKSHIICQVLSFYKCRMIISTHNIKTLQEMSEKINSFSRWRFKVWLYYWKIKTMWDIIITTHTSLNKVNWRIKIKWEEFKPDKSIFIVAKEQEYHFKVLFKLLERMKISKTSNQFHFGYGMIYDGDGKPFSSRLGNAISADEVLKLMVENSAKSIKQKELTSNLSQKEISRRSKIIGFAALSFAFLKVNPLDDIKFDIDKSLSMTGDTGPYILYTYARIKSVLRKANYDESKNLEIDYSVFKEKELALVKILKTYNSVLEDTVNKYKISAVANFLIKLSQSYNDFYQNNHILDQEDKIKNSRLILSYAVSIVIKDALDLLDIETLEEM